MVEKYVLLFFSQKNKNINNKKFRICHKTCSKPNTGTTHGCNSIMPHQHNMTAPVTQQTRDCNSQALLTSKRKKYPISWIPLDNKLKWKHISTSYIIKSENSMYAFEKEFFQRTQVWMKKIRSHHFLRHAWRSKTWRRNNCRN